MTEKEFLNQIWRPYDQVEIEGGIKGNVTTVSFPTRSVKVAIDRNVSEWFKCDLIVKHTSKVGISSDDEYVQSLKDEIEAMRHKINEKNDKIEKQKILLLQATENRAKYVIDDTRKSLNAVKDILQPTKKAIEKIERFAELVDMLEQQVKKNDDTCEVAEVGDSTLTPEEERKVLVDAIENSDTMKQAASRLNVGCSTLRRLMEKHGILPAKE